MGPSGLKVSDTPPQNTIPDYVVFTLQLTGSGLADTDRIRIQQSGGGWSACGDPGTANISQVPLPGTGWLSACWARAEYVAQ